MKEKIRNIIKDEKQFEQVLEVAMDNVGKERDKQIVSSIQNMSEDDFSAMIAGMKDDDIQEEIAAAATAKPGTSKTVPLWKRTYMRVIAACLLLVLVVGVVRNVDLNTGSNQYASLFDTYNNFNEQTRKHLTEYKIGDNKRINGKGAKTTAAILEESAKLICTGNVSDTKAGVQKLKELLTLNYKPSLAPEIHWYLGMGYLKLNMPTEATYELELVKKANGAHASDAAKILEQI